VVSLLLRPLFVLLTLAMLVVASFQLAGRIMFASLDELEPGINQYLAAQQMSVSGLAGDWRLINPIVTIDRIELPAGHLKSVLVELDWLESLVRNRLVAQRIRLGGGRLLLEKTAAGWRLAGAAEGADFNPFDTIYHSDMLTLAVQLGFLDESGVADPVDDLALRYLATNRGGVHRHRLQLANVDCEAPCAVEVRLDQSEAIMFLRPESAAVEVGGAGLLVPKPLLGRAGGRLAKLEGRWWRHDDRSGGTVSAAVDGIGFARIEPVEGRLELSVRGEAGVHHLEVSGLELSAGEASWTLPRVWASYEDNTLRTWTGGMDVAPAFEFFAGLSPEDSAVYRWLNALRVGGTALNVHGLVQLPELKFGYLATVQDITLDGYNGAPWIRGGAGELLGVGRLIQLQLNSEDLGVAFPDIFRQRWDMDHLSGRLQAFIGRGYFGLRGKNLRAELNGSLASGGFALSRPDDRYRERLTLQLAVDQTTVEQGKQYIPYRLPAGLPEWLEHGPRTGNLEGVALAYHGQIHTRPFELARRVELAGDIRDGHVRYHPDWPDVKELSGRIEVAGRDVRILVREGYSLWDTDLAGSRIHLRDNASIADIDLVSTSSVGEALAFIRSTPLSEWMSFVTPDWSGDGALRMAGRLVIPLKQGGDHIGEHSLADEVEVDLIIGLDSSNLELPAYGVSLGELQGEVHYVYPYALSGANVRGRIFDRPALFGASSDADTVIFHVDGQAPYQKVLKLLEVTDPGVILGGLDFNAALHIELDEAVSRLDVVSDLTGLSLDLPAGFAKAPDDAVPTELSLRFLTSHQSALFRYGEAQGWLHVDGTPLRGAIGFGGPPPRVDETVNELVLGGRVSGFTLDQVIPDDSSGPSLSLPLRLVDLGVGLIDINGIGFSDVVLNGRIGAAGATDVALTVSGEDLAGALKISGDDPLVLNLDLLRLPAGESTDDPLAVSVMDELVDVDLALKQLYVGEADYGSWSFALRPREQGVALRNLRSKLRGVYIEADELFWERETNRSHFVGRMAATDLAEVLPLWGYAASVSTEEAAMEADLTWRGSPAAVDLDLLVGQASFEAGNGRFLEVESGGTSAMKIFSLVNFSTIAKRLNFDFSDVSGEGVSFDTMTATAEFMEGSMRFVEPMKVDGSGSKFRIVGTVDLIEGQLDNEMIVTLPVTKGLPWYAAYVALANPLAGLGVLVGERVLRKPLEQFSSAKYQISGTLDDPELKFVNVWDTSVDGPQVSLEQLEPEAVETEPGASDEASGVPIEAEPADETTAQNTGTTTG
jgi:uncharacterized protein (TIGR02099 family)